MILNTKFIHRIKLRTWIIFAIFLILLPVAGFRAINFALGALPALTTRWSLNDATGTNVQDSTTSGNDGTLSNSTWVEPSRCIDGSCIYFDGDTDYISVTDDPDFDFAGADSFTLSIWFRHAPKTSGTEVIVSKFNTGDGDGGYQIQMEADGDITCSIDNDDTTFPSDSVTSTAATYDDNTWHYIACVKNGTSSLTLYIDGLPIIADSSITSSSLENNETFYLGADNGGTTNEFTGYIDEFRLYRTALTAAQIKTDYNFGAAVRVKDIKANFLSEGLTGYWRMNETSGNAVDSSGNSNTLVNNSTTPFTAAKFALGAEFDGSTDFFDLADNVTVSQTGSITLTAWIIPDSVTGSRNIVGKWDGSNESYLLSTEGDELRMYIETGNHQTTSSTNLAINTTYHVAGVYDSSKRTVSLYVNGVLQTSTTTAGTIPASITDDAGEFSVGAEDTGGTAANFFDGHIDDIRFYSRALSGAEVMSLANWAPDAIGYWKMDEGSGTSTVDSSGSGSTGTITGSSSPIWSPGKFGSAVKFPPNATAWTTITAANESVYDLTASVTVSAWIKSGGFEDAWEAIVTKGDSAWRLSRYSSTNFISFSTTGLTNVDLSGTVNVNDGAWHHVVGVYDGANKYIYVDGVLDISTAATGSISTNNYNVVIGENEQAGSRNFNGLIDEVKVYNYARTPQQVVEDMNGGHPTGGSPIGSQLAKLKLNEMNGTTAYDELGNYNATLTNSPTWTTSGKFNSAVDFDNSANNRRHLVFASDAFDGQTSGSVSLWFKPDDTGDDEQALFAVADGTGATNAIELMYKRSTDSIIVWTGGCDSSLDIAASVPVPGTQTDWHHVVYAVNSSGNYFYIDGVLKTPTYTTGNAARTCWFDDVDESTSYYSIGCDYWSANQCLDSELYEGIIDEVQIYSDALTADQVKIVMNASSGIALGTSTNELTQDLGASNPPVGLWQMDENTGTTTTYDTSGNGRNGTLNGSMTQNDWMPGKYGAALEFDGSDDEVSIPDGSAFSTNSYTISAWVYRTTDSGANEHVFDNRDANDDGFRIVVDGTTDRFECAYNAVDSVSAAGTAPVNSWTHVMCISDGSRQYLYVNGSLEDNDAVTGSIAEATNATIGGISYGTGSNFPGRIDNVKVFNYTLNPAQVAYEYDRGQPMAFWKLNENVSGNGQSIKDSSGYSINGTTDDGANNTGMNCTVEGKFNKGCDLDGTDDFISVTGAPTSYIDFESIYEDFSIFAWVKRDTTGEQNIISFEEADNDGWRLQFNSSNQVVCSVDAIDVTSTSAITADSTWHLVGCTIDRDGNGQTYIDGKPNGSTQAISSEIMAITATSLNIGTRGYTVLNYFNGMIDEIQVYPYSLSAIQVKKLYNQNAGARFGPNEGTP